MEKMYYQTPETLQTQGKEREANYDIILCNSCENEPQVITYGDFKFCRKCYPKVEQFLYTKFWEKLFILFGQKKAFEIILYLADFYTDFYTDVFTNEKTKGIINIEKWQDIDKLEGIWLELYAKNLIAYKRVPASDNYQEYVYLKLNLDYQYV